MLTATDLQQYHRDGFLLVPEVFSAEEMLAIQARVNSAPESATTTLFEIGGLEDLWLDPRLLGLARAVLGHAIAFDGEANLARYSFQPGENIKGRHLHHDAKGHPDNLFNRIHHVLPDIYPALRFAIHLQDHSKLSAGIKVSPGSTHIDTSDFNEFELPYVNAPTRPGDVLLFSLRTLHSPFALQFRDFPECALSPVEETYAYAQDPTCFVPHPLKRDVIHIDYFRPDELADLNIKNRAMLIPKPGFSRSVLRARVAEKAVAADIIPRLDLAVSDAVRTVSKRLRNQSISDEDIGLLQSLPTLCRHSVEFSDRFNLIPTHVESDDLEAAEGLFHEIRKKAKAITDAFQPIRELDEHMGERALTVTVKHAKN